MKKTILFMILIVLLVSSVIATTFTNSDSSVIVSVKDKPANFWEWLKTSLGLMAVAGTYTSSNCLSSVCFSAYNDYYIYNCAPNSDGSQCSCKWTSTKCPSSGATTFDKMIGSATTTTTPTTTPTTTTSGTCKDDSNDATIKGYAQMGTSDPVYDKCYDTTTSYEAYCDYNFNINGNIFFTPKGCPSGTSCSDGACKATTTTTGCVDSDSTQSYVAGTSGTSNRPDLTIVGYAQKGTSIEYDRCGLSGDILEAVCDGGNPNLILFNCPLGTSCSGGACSGAPPMTERVDCVTPDGACHIDTSKSNCDLNKGIAYPVNTNCGGAVTQIKNCLLDNSCVNINDIFTETNCLSVGGKVYQNSDECKKYISSKWVVCLYTTPTYDCISQPESECKGTPYADAQTCLSKISCSSTQTKCSDGTCVTNPNDCLVGCGKVGNKTACTASNKCQGVQTCTLSGWGACTTDLQSCDDGSCRTDCSKPLPTECISSLNPYAQYTEEQLVSEEKKHVCDLNEGWGIKGSNDIDGACCSGFCEKGSYFGLKHFDVPMNSFVCFDKNVTIPPTECVKEKEPFYTNAKMFSDKGLLWGLLGSTESGRITKKDLIPFDEFIPSFSDRYRFIKEGACCANLTETFKEATQDSSTKLIALGVIWTNIQKVNYEIYTCEPKPTGKFDWCGIASKVDFLHITDDPCSSGTINIILGFFLIIIAMNLIPKPK